MGASVQRGKCTRQRPFVVKRWREQLATHYKRQLWHDTADRTSKGYWAQVMHVSNERLREIERDINDMESDGYPRKPAQTWTMYQYVKQRGMLPTEYMQQPQYVIDDFEYYDLLELRNQLQTDVADAKRELGRNGTK